MDVLMIEVVLCWKTERLPLITKLPEISTFLFNETSLVTDKLLFNKTSPLINTLPLTSIVAAANELLFPNPVLLSTLITATWSLPASVFNFNIPPSTDIPVVVVFPSAFIPTNVIV